MGESRVGHKIGMDEEIMPYIDMANLACGFHASEPVTMHRSIKLAKTYDVTIGAHPSYPDLEGFGRREMDCSIEEIVSLVLYQCGALDGICRSYGEKVSYVKPHGALYNTMMKDREVFKAICKAVSKYDTNIKLMILSTTQNHIFEKLAQKYNITLLYEVFADRAYTDEGLLVSRSEPNAMLQTSEEIRQRAQLLLEKGSLKTVNGNLIELQADTICVHGDTQEALEHIKILHHFLNHEN